MGHEIGPDYALCTHCLDGAKAALPLKYLNPDNLVLLAFSVVSKA